MTANPQSAVDKALAERDRIVRFYRKAKAAEFRELCADPVHGTRLRKFVATLNHFQAGDATRMIAYIRGEASWLREASGEFRNVALHAISNRIVRLRTQAGLPPFDDPLPDQPDRVFQTAKQELGL